MAVAFQWRQRNFGLVCGSVWLVAISMVFAIWALLAADSPFAAALLAGMSAVAGVLIYVGIGMSRAVIRLPVDSLGRPSQAGRIYRRFFVVFAIEVVGCTAVSVACVYSGHWKFITPLMLVIVGLHFLPLARLFDVPRYYILGLLFCGISIITMLMVPQSARVGHALSWIVIPCVGCALSAFIIAGQGLREVGRFVSESREGVLK